jgi:hypothetical protein
MRFLQKKQNRLESLEAGMPGSWEAMRPEGLEAKNNYFLQASQHSSLLAHFVLLIFLLKPIFRALQGRKKHGNQSPADRGVAQPGSAPALGAGKSK